MRLDLKPARTLACVACAALLPLALAACGDDAKTGSRGAPAAAPGTPPATAPAVPAPADGGEVRTPDAATAKVGDWVTWEVRAAGSDSGTQLTWRALSLDGSRVRFSITSETRDASGKVLSHVVAEESRPASDGSLPAGTPDSVKVAGRDLPTVRTDVPDGTVWRSRVVPLGGLVRSKGPGGVEQVLVGYGRGR